MKRGVAICHYRRYDELHDLIHCVKDTAPEGTRIVVCDDGSPPCSNGTPIPSGLSNFVCDDVILIKGPNLGVAANKNRALWALQDCQYIAILEDDLFPIEKGWFEIYEKVAKLTDNHHFCRVQDKQIEESYPDFSAFLKTKGYTPLFASSPRGDFTFLTSAVISRVGGFNPEFRGAGYAHGEWSNRVRKAGLISHPLAWWDVKEARDKFEQRGDTVGGRWGLSEKEIQEQLGKNKQVLKRLQKKDYIYHPLTLE